MQELNLIELVSLLVVVFQTASTWYASRSREKLRLEVEILPRVREMGEQEAAARIEASIRRRLSKDYPAVPRGVLRCIPWEDLFILAFCLAGLATYLVPRWNPSLSLLEGVFAGMIAFVGFGAVLNAREKWAKCRTPSTSDPLPAQSTSSPSQRIRSTV